MISQSVLRSSLSTQSLIEIQHATQAKILGRSCVEDAVQLFLTDVSYRGDEERTLENGTCTVLPIAVPDLHAVTITVRATTYEVPSTLSITFDATLPHVATSIWEVW